MPPNRFESEVESFLEGSHGDRTHIKRADHHTVTPLCGTLLLLAPLTRSCAAIPTWWLLGAAARGRRSQALLARRPVCLKPLSPLFAGICVGLKPSSPVRVRNGRLWCSFWAQRCRRFQWCLVEGEQWCCWFQRCHVSASCARNFSPRSV